MGGKRKCEIGCTCGRHRGTAYAGPSYDLLHKRVYRSRGKASERDCVGCDNQADEWSQLHGTDGTDPLNHYQPMCVTCHRQYDGWDEMISEAQRRRWANIPQERRKASVESREKNAESQRRRWAAMSPTQRAELSEKLSAAQRGKPKSPEAAENIRKAAKQRALRQAAQKSG